MGTEEEWEIFRFNINFQNFQHYTKVNSHNVTVHTNVLVRKRPSHSSKTLNVIFTTALFVIFDFSPIPKPFFSDLIFWTVTHNAIYRCNVSFAHLSPQYGSQPRKGSSTDQGIPGSGYFHTSGIRRTETDIDGSCITVLARSGPVSSLGGVPHSPASQPLKGLSDVESRDPARDIIYLVFTNAPSVLPKSVIGPFHNFPRWFSVRQIHRSDCVFYMTTVRVSQAD